MTTRVGSDTDRSLGRLSGLFADDHGMHPAYQKEILEYCHVAMCSYPMRGAPDNYSAFRRPDLAVGHLSLPGAWVFQFATHAMAALIEVLRAFFDVAVLGLHASSTRDLTTHQLQRAAAPPSSG